MKTIKAKTPVGTGFVIYIKDLRYVATGCVKKSENGKTYFLVNVIPEEDY